MRGPLACLAAACSISLAAPAPAQPPKPNIVFILADDLGINDLGVYGQNARRDAGEAYISTPNMDTLAHGGLRFNEWYAPATVCAPTRVSILTGFHGGHAAVDSNGLNNNGGNAMRAVDYSFAQSLQSAGYSTGAFGKWGSGMDGTQLSPSATGDSGLINHQNPEVTHPDSTPAAKGFDEFYGYLNHIHAHNYYVEYLWEHDTDNSGDVGGMQVDWSPTTSDYAHDLIAAKSIDFIRDHADDEDPFFMYAEYTIPHDDYNPPNDEFLQMYTDPVSSGGQGLSGNQADYAAMITRMDHNVGQIMDALRDPNGDDDESDSIVENTLVLIGTDNGPTNSAPTWFDSNGIYRGTKNDVYEGAHRSPFIAYWEGQIVPIDAVNGDVNATHYGTHSDLFATFGDLAGYDVPVGLDSRSMAGLLTGDSEQVDEHTYLVWEDRPSGDWAIRFGDYKLLKTGSNVVELYNLASDPSETSNLLNSPTTQEQAIANLLQQIALDEGVESDAGAGGAQNTHIVQYKAWDVTGGSSFNSAANWTGGSQFNTRGTAANNFSTGPASNWIPTMENTSRSDELATVTSNAEVLALEVTGGAFQMALRIENTVTLTTRNGARVNDGGRIELDGGALQTVRTVEVRSGGELAGRGEIRTPYDTTGTPFTLEATVVNDGRLEIGGAEVTSATPTVELISNGGFESGTDWPFQDTDDWFNFAEPQTLNARNQSNPYSGTFRGIVGLNSNGVDEPAPAQDTGHAIALGEAYELNFFYGGASQWDEGSDSFTATLYYLDGSTPVTLDSLTVTPNLNFGDGYESVSHTFAPITDAGAVGQSLLIRFETNAQSNEFASVDDVSLLLPGSPTNILAVAGDLSQGAGGVMAFDLFGSGGVAGIDFDQLTISGDLALAGDLEVSDDGTVTYAVGDVFEIIQVDGLLSGAFDTVSLLPALAVDQGWQVNYTAAGVSLEVVEILPGDYNGDNLVDAADYALWRNTLGSTSDLQADGDRNGAVDAADYIIWRQHYGQTLSASASGVVPEPGSLLLAALVTAALATRRRP